ncbi:MAG TPA: efflux RND transporter periplasmic adaptor subunit [Flavobacteriaceae bacterium]|nr:efflux RND transporter periplasmic adaptor subunit [Flavobacteriaceae bacterium]
MKKNISLLFLLTLTTLIVSCGSDQNNTSVEATPVAVKVQAGTGSSHASFLATSGKIQAENSANLSTRVMGFVDKIHVKVGDQVKEGQLLAAINNTDLQAKLAQVQAGIAEATVAYNNAEKDYLRFKNLYAENSATQKELDDITAQFEMAKARLEAAKYLKNEVNAQFNYVNIKAPFAGEITHVFIEAGDIASPGMALLAIESPNHFEVETLVPESEITQIKNGMPVDVRVSSINQTVKGKVTEVSSSAKNTGGQYQVKVALEKTQASIRSGMFATVQFPVDQKESAAVLLVPSKAIVTQGELTGIYTVSQSHTAILRWLRLGRTFGDNVEVLSGLTPEESYIVSAEGKLYNGVKVTIQ